MATEQPQRAAHGVDAHCHLDAPAFHADLDAVLDRARAAGVGSVVVPASDPTRWPTVRRIAEERGLWFAIGVHPWWVSSGTLDALPEAARGAHAIGETGLDYATATSDAERRTQRRAFDAHLQLASDTDRPVVLHAVKALPDVLSAIEHSGVRAQLHGAVRGDLARAIRAGIYLSFGPALTRSAAARRWAKEAPRGQVLLETDGPDHPLEPPRGEPAHVGTLADHLAELWQTDRASVLAQTGANARRLFGEPSE